MRQELKSFWDTIKKPFITIVVILTIALVTLFRANFFYIDDQGRALNGYRGWSNFSRYTSSSLSVAVHTNEYLGDIAPLSQLIAIAIVAMACCILLYVFKIKLYQQKKITFIDTIAASVLALCPYFLECLSYRFDSPYMALSILASVVPLLFISKSKPFYYGAISIGTLIMCTTYQAASGIFPMCVVFVCLAKFIKGTKSKEIFKFAFWSLLAYGVGILCFKTFMMAPVAAGDDYVDNAILPLDQLITGGLSNLKKYYSFVKNDFRLLWLVIIAIICVLFIILATIKAERKHKIVCAFVILFGLGCAAVMAFGLYPLLAKPLMAPRAMYGFGVLIALIVIQISSLLEGKKYLQLPSMALVYCFVVFALIYGNALAQQQKWVDFRMNLLAADLQDLQVIKEKNEVTVNIQGTVGFAKPVENYINGTDGKMLSRLLPIQLRGLGWYWGAMPLQYYLPNDVKVDLRQDKSELDFYKKQVDTAYHTIYVKNDKIIIVLK